MPAQRIFQADVAILMGSAHGEHFIEEQLISIERQTHANWRLFVSDDGSADRTREHALIFKRAQPEGRVELIEGPQKGFVENFLTLTCNRRVQADYYAYCDQDDIWESDKLQRALTWLETVPGHTPAVYCTRTSLIDAVAKHIGYSPLFRRPPAFRNALVQSIAGGNTMVFNNAARDLVCHAGAVNIPSHDWWLYILVSGAGGRVHYDAYPSVRYRQHGNNLVGSNQNMSSRLHRVHQLFKGRLRRWSDLHIAALYPIRHILTPENRHVLEDFARCRDGHAFARIVGMKRNGLYRQTLFGSVGLALAFATRKI